MTTPMALYLYLYIYIYFYTFIFIIIVTVTITATFIFVFLCKEFHSSIAIDICQCRKRCKQETEMHIYGILGNFMVFFIY